VLWRGDRWPLGNDGLVNEARVVVLAKCLTMEFDSGRNRRLGIPMGFWSGSSVGFLPKPKKLRERLVRL
jgi:hypothetical protein